MMMFLEAVAAKEDRFDGGYHIGLGNIFWEHLSHGQGRVGGMCLFQNTAPHSFCQGWKQHDQRDLQGKGEKPAENGRIYSAAS